MSVHHISLAINKNQHSQDSEHETLKSSTTWKEMRPVLLSKVHVAKLFLALADMYGNLFVSKNGIEDSGVWFDSLCDLTPFALDNAIEKLRSLKASEKFIQYPPSCLEFRALCLSFYSDLRLPGMDEAYREIQSRAFKTRQNWSHPAVKYTARKLGDNYLNIRDEREAYAKFKETYEKVCHLVRQGYQLSDIKEPVMLARPASRETASFNLAMMRQYLK